MRLLHVHIGAHKTGSTAIQCFLREHAAELARRGVVVPEAGRLGDGQAGHHALYDNPDPADILAEIDGAPAAVVSCENLEHWSPETALYFAARLRSWGWEPHWIWFHRRPGDYAVALHHELAKHKVGRSFPRMLAEIRREGRFTARNGRAFVFDPAEFAGAWPEPLTMIDYDAVRADLAGAFCRAIGVEPFAPAPPDVNVTRRGPAYLIRRRIARAVL